MQNSPGKMSLLSKTAFKKDKQDATISRLYNIVQTGGECVGRPVKW